MSPLDGGLNPPLSASEVLAFEQAHNILLPSDYRLYLTTIGNGGDGPSYGVFPLGYVDDNFDIRPWHEGDGLVGDLSEPFPFSESWNDLTGMPASESADSITGPEETEYDRQWKAFTDTYWRTTLVNGAIPICHLGCALRIYLVVTGPQAGYLWEDRRAEFVGIRPVQLTDGSAATFSGWYEEWLSSCVTAKHSHQQ